MSFWPFPLDSQAEQRQSQRSTPSSESSQHNTRSSNQPLLPPLAAGRGKNGPRSPAALAAASTSEFFPPDLVIEPPSPSTFEDAEMAASESEIDRLTRIAEAAINAATAATQALTAAQSRSKKPELPPFDRKNVELWIKRIEAAYQRAGVTLPKDKFAYLEQKFPVDFNVKVNDYLFGDATEERWTSFLAYLKDEYGKSTRQQTATLLSSHPRSGLKPTAFLINLKDKTKKVTVDHIYKEILIKSLPADVQHALVDRFDDMTAEEAATAADKYFDNEGRPLSASSTTSSVNAVQPQQEQQEDTPNFTAPFSDEEADVNFVSKRQFSRNNKFGSSNNNNNNFKPKQRQFGSNFSSNSSTFRQHGSSSSSTQKNNHIKPNGLCWAHDKFKQDAHTCLEGCSKFNQHTGKKLYPGNATPGRRA